MVIICPACQATNAHGAALCEQCGASLVGVVPTQEWEVNGITPASGTPIPSGRSTIITEASGEEVLLPADRTPPTDFPQEPIATLPPAGPQESDPGRSSAGSVATRLRVLVLNSGRLTDWLDEPLIHVGRTDHSANVFPNIDLEDDGGHNAGVSRRHVRISRQADGFYLEDLGSINGSFLNRRRLSPGTPTELRDGDEVRLGNIVLRVVLGGFQRAQ